MATNASLCALCDLRHLTTPSTHWCPDCEEALCINCKEHHSLSKSSRNHHVIPISEYINLPSCIANIDLFCTYHNEKYIQYCVKHESPICYKCIKEHGKCGELVLFEELVCDIKLSEAFKDTIQSLTDIMVYIGRVREDRTFNIEMIKIKKKQVIEEVSRWKDQINVHLVKLQDDFTKEFDKIEIECCEKIQSIVSSLNDQDKEMIKCKTDMENIQIYTSDSQAYMSMREIQQKITKTEKSIQSMVDNKEIEEVHVQYTIDPKIQDFLTNVEIIGSFTVKNSPSDCKQFVRKKDRQAQQLATERKQNIQTIKLKLMRKLETTCGNTGGGCVTAKGEYIFTNYQTNGEKLVTLTTDENVKCKIQLSSPYSSFDLVSLGDNTVAVTTGISDEKTGIIIVDLNTRLIKRFVSLPSPPYGIDFDGKSLICCCNQMAIHLISCTDFSFTTIVDTFFPEFAYITTHSDRILYTNSEENEVYCCLYSGELVWKFKNESVLKDPRGIAADDKGNIFVVGLESQNILVISSDGKSYKAIQTSQYGLPQPSTICFDKIRKQMLVANEQDFAHLYDISY